MKKDEPIKPLHMTTFPRPPVSPSYGEHSPPEPTINGYNRFLRWMNEDSWTLTQAILLYLSIDPSKIPSGYIKNLQLLTTYPGVQEKANEFADLHRIALQNKKKGKIEDPMSPDRWIDWLISSGNEMNEQFFKAYKATFPDTTWEPKKISYSYLHNYIQNFQRSSKYSCASCTEKDSEIQKLKNEIESLRKGENVVNRNKMLLVIAGLIRVYYRTSEDKVTSITKEMISDLQTVGCNVTHETLKKYLDEGK